MKFTPKTQQELDILSNERPLLPDGIYDFSVTDAQETYSEAGNEMVKLILAVYDSSGCDHVLFDYLLDAMAFKLHHFCKATGLYHLYQTGNLEAYMCIGKHGKLKLGTQKGKPKKDGSGIFPDANTVKDYIVNEEKTNNTQHSKEANAPHKAFEGQEDDPDVPF